MDNDVKIRHPFLEWNVLFSAIILEMEQNLMSSNSSHHTLNYSSNPSQFDQTNDRRYFCFESVKYLWASKLLGWARPQNTEVRPVASFWSTLYVNENLEYFSKYEHWSIWKRSLTVISIIYHKIIPDFSFIWEGTLELCDKCIGAANG